MIAPRVLSRVLNVFVIVLSVVAETSSVTSAQELPESGGVGLVETPGITIDPIVIQPASIMTDDLTGEGMLIGMPTGPITVEPAPSTSAPPPEATAPPPTTVTASDIPERASIWDAIFAGKELMEACEDNSHPLCVPAP